ncbi:hypothetical protein [Muricoccus radiodurans]|uniref:hypothetical protein n=1 Tax=Muricoccus radiodurans TaxID=2231721 RepID=UPI003CF10540
MRERTDPRQHRADHDGQDDCGIRAAVAADIAAGALDRGAPHTALAAAREAARAALLVLGRVPHQCPNDDRRFLTILAAAPPDHLVGLPDEREVVVRQALAILARMLPPTPGSEAFTGLPDPAAGGGDAPVSGRPRVLVVEDEWFIAADVKDCLEQAGVEVVGPVSTVGDALRLVEAASTDGGITAAILDMKLDGAMVTPVADALTAIRVPFVYVTGYSEDHVRSGNGTAAVLQKPVHYPDLLRAVWAIASPGGGALPAAM